MGTYRSKNRAITNHDLWAWLRATAPSGRFQHANKHRNPFHQNGFRHAELARRRPSARPSRVAGTWPQKPGPTIHEVTTGLHRFAKSRCGHTIGALPPPRAHTPTIHPTTDNPGGLWQACNTLHRSHVWKLFLRQSRRKLLQRSTIAYHDVLERIPSPNTAAQHEPIPKCLERAQSTVRCGPKVRSAALNGRPARCPEKPPAPCSAATLKSPIFWPLRRVGAVVALFGLPKVMRPGRRDGQADFRRQPEPIRLNQQMAYP